MKDFFEKLKANLPLFKEKFLGALSILLVYQAFLFIISPTLINQILAGSLLIIFGVQYLIKKN